MFELVKLFYDICLFKKGPQDVPSSSWLLQWVIVVYAIISFLILFLGADIKSALFQVLVEIVLLVIFAKVILMLFGKTARFSQTVCAFFGTDALISFIALPGVATMATGKMGLVVFGLILLLMLWHWLVIAHIVRHAIAQSFSFGAGIALLYIMGSYQVMAFLFPAIAGT